MLDERAVVRMTADPQPDPLTDELPNKDRCTCVRDDVRCSLGRMAHSRDSRCEGCAMGLHKGHRTTSPAAENDAYTVAWHAEYHGGRFEDCPAPTCSGEVPA